MHILKDFKGFKEAHINFFKPMNFLIGSNGSGKTNLIEGVNLLAVLVQGKPLHEITDIDRGGGTTFQLRGGLQSCPTIGKNKFTIEFAALVPFRDDKLPLVYSIEISVEPYQRISREKLRIGNRTFFDARTQLNSPGVLLVRYDNFSKGHNPSMSLSAERSVLSRYNELLSGYDITTIMRSAAIESVGILKKYLAASFVFDPNASTMRRYERIGQQALLKDGSNLSSVLYYMRVMDNTINDQSHKILDRIVSNIRQLPEEPFDNIDFITTTQNDVLLAMVKPGGDLIDARLLSDGTLRSLAVLTAFEVVERGSRIVVEEFDNGLHPSRTKVLVNAIWEACQRKSLNCLVTTHNPATLNNLTDEQLDGVSICYWDKKAKTSVVKELNQIDNIDILLEKDQLGNLVTKEILNNYLIPNLSESQKQKALNWLGEF